MTDSVKFEYDLKQTAEKILRDDIEEFMTGDSEPAAIDFERILNRRFSKRVSVIKPYLTAAAAMLAVGAAVFIFARTHLLNFSSPIPETVVEMTEYEADIVSEPEPETDIIPAAEKETDSENVTQSVTVETTVETLFEPAPAVVETEPPAPAVPAQAARIDETISFVLPVGGGESDCIHSGIYHNSFHDFNGDLIDYVGIDRFNEFINTDIPFHGYTSEECRFSINIYEFIKYFNIDREEFEKFYYSSIAFYFEDYNIDILYGGDEQKIYDYYSSNGSYAEMQFRNADFMIKLFTGNYIGQEAWVEWQEDMGYKNYTYYSIAEIIYHFGISRDAFESIVNNEKEKIKSAMDRLPRSGHWDENGIFVTDEISGIETYELMLKSYDYDIDFIYGEREYIESIIGETEPYKIDRMCHNF